MSREKFVSTATRGRRAKASSSRNLNEQHGVRQELHQEDEPWTIISIDFGTGTFSACYAKKYPNKPLERGDDRPFYFSEERSHTGEMVAAWHDGEFHFGTPLIRKEKSGLIPAHKVIAGFKLLLYDKYRDSDRVLTIRNQLEEAGQSFEQLLVEVLKCIWAEILLEARHRFVDIDLARTMVYIPVPMIATPEATDQMAQAAKKAGLPGCRFPLEPLCAGVTILDALIGDRRTKAAYEPIRACCVQSIDMGGGTTDIVTLRLPQDIEQIKHNWLHVESTAGVLCGSMDVDQNFRHWIEKEIESCPGGFAAAENELLLSKEAILRRASVEFQAFKKDPDARGALTIRCSRTRGKKSLEFELDNALVESFFKDPVQKIIDLAETKWTPHIKYIILSGGFAESKYVVDRIRRNFEYRGVEVKTSIFHYTDAPMARGALMVDDNLDQTSNASKYSFGLLYEDEDANIDDHPDAFDSEGNDIENVVFKDHFYSQKRNEPSYIVHDRITWLLRKDAARANAIGHFETEMHPQQFHIALTDPTIDFTFVYTTKNGCRDHEAPKDEMGNIKPEFRIHKEKIRLSDTYVKRLKKYGRMMQPKRPDGSRPKMLEFYCTVGMKHNNVSMKVIKRFIKPEKFIYLEDENWHELLRDKLEYDSAEWEEIFDANFDTEIIDTRLPHPEQRKTCTTEAGHTWSRSPTLQASPQPQRRALQQIAQSASQQLPRPMPNRLPHARLHEGRSQGQQPPPRSKQNGKRRRSEPDDVDLHRPSAVIAGPSTVRYDFPVYPDQNEIDESGDSLINIVGSTQSKRTRK